MFAGPGEHGLGRSRGGFTTDRCLLRHRRIRGATAPESRLHRLRRGQAHRPDEWPGGLGRADAPLRVTSHASAERAVAEIISAEGRIDVLVNNAGYGSYGVRADVALDEGRARIDVNLFDLARMAQLVLPRTRARRSGTIVDIGVSVTRPPFRECTAGQRLRRAAGYLSGPTHENEVYGASVG
ncbi:SDR family NAD(P)-dependent oxidoreductase [Streptomyces sp. NK08204]|uniref:SDR family NAD(P)-dependent oxidoreductase n=1 Tax=Streptomyces sp. NK08204 TaxID=2873260 RepID=UPI001CED0A16|nr:SDR family NAD(P)-dependent oxidoreductase [Streptomyces sp. NK08204]